MHVFVGANYILSVRNNHARDFLGVRARCEREPKMLAKGPGYVLYALMDAVVDGYFPLIEKLETEVEALEDRIFTKGAARSNIRRLYRLKRKVTLLKHAVLPLMEAAGKLHSGRVPEVCAKSRHYFRDVYDHLARINASLDSIRETIGTAIQVEHLAGHHRPDRGQQAPGRLGRHLRGGHRVCRHLGDELRPHARAGVGIRLPFRPRRDRQRQRPPVVALPQGPVAVASWPSRPQRASLPLPHRGLRPPRSRLAPLLHLYPRLPRRGYNRLMSSDGRMP